MTLFESYVPKSGTVTVPPVGSLSSKIAFVGEAPGKDEVSEGIPFVGKSGKLFNKLLYSCGIWRKQSYITNLFKFEVKKRKRKIGNSDVEHIYRGNDLLWNAKDGFTPLGKQSRDSLFEELSGFEGNVIVPMGNPALFAFTGESYITKWRGSILWNDTLKKKVIPTIHPASALRNYLDGRLIKFDLLRIKEESKTPEYNPPSPHLIIEPTFPEGKLFLSKCREAGKFAYDIEVMNSEVSCISFSYQENEAISIPFIGEGGNYFTLEQEIELWDIITNLLEDEDIIKVGQNLAFDNTFLFMRYGIRVHNCKDTMIAHKILYPEFPKSLAFICSTYTRHPFYKDEGKAE